MSDKFKHQTYPIHSTLTEKLEFRKKLLLTLEEIKTVEQHPYKLFQCL